MNPASPPVLASFVASQAGAIAVTLEVQIVNQHDYDLTPGAADVLRLLARQTLPGTFLPEAIDSQVAFSTGLCGDHAELLGRLVHLRDAVVRAADTLGLGVVGGGTHAFHDRRQRQGVRRPRLAPMSTLYGDLSRQLMVFGLQVHLGCDDADEALLLMQGLGRFVPHLVALSASSPFLLGHDSGFDSARLRGISALPTTGCAPPFLRWDDLAQHFERMARTGVVLDMQDCLWDIRPRPELGTLELRVMDTPLTVDKAAALAAVVQCLARWLARNRPVETAEPDALAYDLNRFHASRFGLDGRFVDPVTGESRVLRDDLDQVLAALAGDASDLAADNAIRLLRGELSGLGNDAAHLRRCMNQAQFLPEVVRQQTLRWAGRG